VILEYKTGSAERIVTQTSVAEVAKYRDTYVAAHCLLIRPP
jgi:hypothetical protein